MVWTRGGRRMQGSKKVTINYRRFVDTTGAFDGKSLSEAVKEALRHEPNNDGKALADDWTLRAWGNHTPDSTVWFMNRFRRGKRFIYGDLTAFTRGEFQSVVDRTDQQQYVDISQFSPPDGQEFVRGMLHWVAIRNHIFIIQDKSLRENALEQYLTWLLTRQTRTARQDAQVILAKSLSLPESAAYSDLQTIEIGGLGIDWFDAVSEDEGQPDQDRGRQGPSQEIDRRRFQFDRVKGVLSGLFNDQTEVDNLIEHIPIGARLEVDISIGYRKPMGTRRKKLSAGSLERTLRNLPDGEIKAHGPDGVIIANDMILKRSANVAVVAGSLLDPRDVVRAAFETYRYFVHRGKIEREVNDPE